MKCICLVIMWSLQTRIEKSFSYSISYSYSNLKVPNADVTHVTHCGKTRCSIFKTKVAYQAEDRPADICLKLTST